MPEGHTLLPLIDERTVDDTINFAINLPTRVGMAIKSPNIDFVLGATIAVTSALMNSPEWFINGLVYYGAALVAERPNESMTYDLLTRLAR